MTRKDITLYSDFELSVIKNYIINYLNVNVEKFDVKDGFNLGYIFAEFEYYVDSKKESMIVNLEEDLNDFIEDFESLLSEYEGLMTFIMESYHRDVESLDEKNKMIHDINILRTKGFHEN